MEVTTVSGTIRVSDGDGVVCRIDAEDWSEADGPAIDAPVETSISGQATRLRFPPGRVEYRSDGGREGPTPGVEKRRPGIGGPLRIDGAAPAVLAFDGAATVEDSPDGVDVWFGEPRRVTLGLGRRDSGEDRTVTVPATPEGVATALTHAGAAHSTASPARSHPATRRNPPRIRRGDATVVPDAIRDRRPDTGIDLRVPADLASLFVLAPLAFYLGARVTVEPRETPLLSAPDAGVRHELSALPELQADAASLLYRAVTLDCLLREIRSESGGSPERRLAAVGIDPDRVGDRGIAGRLAAYLEAPFRGIAAELPEWHLSVYATPAPEHVAALPYVLDRLAFVYLPDATRLPEEERLQRSLEDFYRAPGDAATVDPILPDLNRGRLHAWLSDGVAIDAFRLLPCAHPNRRSRPAPTEPTDVTVVVNDPEMRPEAAATRRIYRRGADEGGVDLRIERRLDRGGLAAALRRPTDLLHYVGHCDRAGLRCTDGHLDATGIDHSGARTFFLNACGSYHQGLGLVEAGSVAGAVTLRPVLDAQAKRVGTAFARLLTRGFAVERALRIASRRTIMNKDYAVVGDGTYALRSGDASRAVTRISRVGGEFRVRVEHGTADATLTRRPALLGDGRCLSGAERSAPMSREKLCEFLRGLSLPAVYEGRYYWASELRRALIDGDLAE